jgi:hypothetical protein
MLFHGSDNSNLKIKSMKDGFGYHPGAGPVEFLGPSFSDSYDVAQSYGKHVFEREFTPKKPKKYRSLNALRNDILKTFSLRSGISLAQQYRDIADSYKAKLLAEGYDAVIFPEGLKTSVNEKVANTVIILNV